jgi:hypothetical protein
VAPNSLVIRLLPIWFPPAHRRGMGSSLTVRPVQTNLFSGAPGPGPGQHRPHRIPCSRFAKNGADGRPHGTLTVGPPGSHRKSLGVAMLRAAVVSTVVQRRVGR